MPRMVPEISPSSITNSGEKAVYKALLEQLPDDWVVRYHYPACWLRGNGLRECESDFIVLAPGMGLMFLEVKGSRGYDCRDGKWFRIKPSGEIQLMERSPWDQATSTKHQIVNKLSHQLGFPRKSDFPGIFGHMVVFPKARLIGKIPNSVDSSLVLNGNHMRDLKNKLENAFGLWGAVRESECWQCRRPFRRQDGVSTPGKGNSFTHEVMEKVLDFLKDDCRFIPVLAPEVDEEDEVIQELTRQQFRTFQQLLCNDRILVKGTAGSGKTMIAFWAAQALTEKGKKVLFICYNRQLAKWLQLKNDPQNQLLIRSFHVYCREVVVSRGGSFDIPVNMKQDDFWKGTAAELFLHACDQLDEEDKYDAIFVDEAQDFHDSWWLPVELSLKDPDNGNLYLFLDPQQAGVYGHGDSYPGHNMACQDLGENCRNTKKITEYCSKVIGEQIDSFELSPLGENPLITEANEDSRHRAQIVKKLISNLLKEGFAPSQIAVLSHWSIDKSSLAHIPNVDNIPLKSGEDNVDKWIEDELIFVSTIKSFKGMEADCIIITDMPSVGRLHFETADLYVATSRAKHRLAFVPVSSDSEKQLMIRLQSDDA